METPGRVVLFDGVCNFCGHWVQFALKRDKNQTLRFTTLQGETAKTLLPRFGINPSALTSVVFIDNEKVYTQSSAALRICKHLRGGWPLLYGFIIIPRFIRDALYNLFARNRYRWFGKKDSCMVPAPGVRHRFLP
jgi:predicted DCC family thiol-disulfide oxidoreductase YuxK